MRIVEPEIYILAATHIEEHGVTHSGVTTRDGDLPAAAKGMDAFLSNYLPDDDQLDDFVTESGFSSDGEFLIEIAGRTCYRSFAPGLNPNVSKIRTGNRAYVGNILKHLHGSVLEHASITFAFRNVSRVFTHELVRHRSGTAISQESMRYVRLDDIPFAASGELDTNLNRNRVEDVVTLVEETIEILTRKWDLDNASFSTKKLKTSAMRRLAPIGTATTIIWTSNLRELRHVITLRTAAGAEEEIRKVFRQVAVLAIDMFPNVFQDFTEQPDGSFEPKHWKV